MHLLRHPQLVKMFLKRSRKDQHVKAWSQPKTLQKWGEKRLDKELGKGSLSLPKGNCITAASLLWETQLYRMLFISILNLRGTIALSWHQGLSCRKPSCTQWPSSDLTSQPDCLQVVQNIFEDYLQTVRERGSTGWQILAMSHTGTVPSGRACMQAVKSMWLTCTQASFSLSNLLLWTFRFSKPPSLQLPDGFVALHDILMSCLTLLVTKTYLDIRQSLSSRAAV